MLRLGQAWKQRAHPCVSTGLSIHAGHEHITAAEGEIDGYQQTGYLPDRLGVAARCSRAPSNWANLSRHERPAAPAHLSPSAREWWKITVERYELQEHHLRLLQLACEAWDRAQAARERLDREGLTVSGSKGFVRPHPCIVIERDSRLAVARLLRELDLDAEPPAQERLGPPAIFSNKGHLRRARETTDS